VRTCYPKVGSHTPWTPPAQTEGDALTLTLDVNPEATRLGTSVSSVTWSIDTGRASIRTETLTSNVATALVTTNMDGLSLIKVKITLADGQIINQHIKIVSKDTYANDRDYTC